MDAKEDDFGWLEAAPEQVERKYGILNAVRLPGVDPATADVHDRSSPVNTLRYVMNTFFDADLPFVPDSVLLSPTRRTDDGAPLMPAAGDGG